MKKLKTYQVKAFTLIEMLVVLLIISVLLLLFVPNLTKQKDSVKETGNAAVVKVVESQAESTPSLPLHCCSTSAC